MKHQELAARMEADMKLNREAAQKTITEINKKMQSLDEQIDSLIQQKQALSLLLFRIEDQLARLP